MRTALILVSLLVLGACQQSAKHHEQAGNRAPLTVHTLSVQRAPAPLSEAVMGTVAAAKNARLSARVAANVREVAVQLGQVVQEGQPLLHLDAAELHARLRQAEAARDQAEQELARMDRLLASKAVSQSDYDQVSAQARMTRANVAEAQAMLTYTTIQAPFTGVITGKMVDQGDLALPGITLLEIADPTSLELHADIPEQALEHVELGQELVVEHQGTPLSATLKEIAPSADPQSRTIRIKASLPAHSGLRLGAFARLRVPLGQREDLRVPRAAVLERGGLTLVFTAEAQTARMYLVRLGRQEGELVSVQSGLPDGATVIVNPPQNLRDGQAIRRVE